MTGFKLSVNPAGFKCLSTGFITSDGEQRVKCYLTTQWGSGSVLYSSGVHSAAILSTPPRHEQVGSLDFWIL